MNRRRLLRALAASPLTATSLAAGAAAAATPPPPHNSGPSALDTPDSETPGRTFVLLHGMYAGGWAWHFVAPILSQRGHQVYAPTMTGLGDRSHLLSRQITLDTHIEDIANTIETEELRDITLVAHSYGGMVGTAIADMMTDRIRRLIYVDALIPESGENGYAVIPPSVADRRRRAAGESGAGVAFPVSVKETTHLAADSMTRSWARRHLRPHPAGTYETPVHLSRPAGAGLPVTYIACERPALPSIEPSRQRARAKPGWTVISQDVPHNLPIYDPVLAANLIASYG